MKLRVGLIGLGSAWDARHQPALRALGDRYEVRVVCEQISHRAQQAAKEFGATAVDGFRAVAQREDVDAVLMLSAQWYGALPVFAACDSGKALYCAAAMDLDLAQASRIKKRIEDAGIAFMAEFPNRHAPATLRLKELIATRLGQPRLLFCHKRLVVKDTRGTDRSTQEQDSPILRELVELVDWCRYVIGKEPTSVLGMNHASHSAAAASDDYQMMSLSFGDSGQSHRGPTAQISCGHYIPETWHEAHSFRPPSALQVRCENGIAFIDMPSNLVWFDDAGRHQESLERERPVGEQLLAHFHRAVTSLVRRTTDLEDAYRALHVALKARTSARKSRRLRLDL